MAVDTTGLTREQEVDTPVEGKRYEQVATVRLHAKLRDGRTVQIMPGNDARAVVPHDAKISWHERMGKTPQEAALAGASPTSGAEVTKMVAVAGPSDQDMANRVAGLETEIRKLKEALAARLTAEELDRLEKEKEALQKEAADPERVRTTIKPGPAKPEPATPDKPK